MGANPVLRERMQVIRVIEDLTQGRFINIGQDGRKINDHMDIPWVYLLYWGNLGGLAAVDEQPAIGFAIVDHNSRIRPQIVEFYRKQGRTEFEHVTLYYIQRESIPEWRRLIARYPSPTR